MQKKIIGVALLIIVLAQSAAGAQEHKGVGVGVIIGEPTGVSVKQWISETNALDAAAGWSFSENDSFQFHADYLIHNFSLFTSDQIKGKLPVYVGVGGRLKLEENDGRGRNADDPLVGIRVPFGISYVLAGAPVDIFAEVVPLIDIVPDTVVDINAAVGVRLYFK